ncbi:nucleotidyltransferase domain-containing protein [Paenisporosarcina quisquiliarum]|uniref:nucleotidyltransferase domain-containing protein n=1 Tax=Paenisporosarcina quisquiliarum TaxID=365346 RepID=UPI003736C346
MLSEKTQQQLIQIINQQLDTDFIILFGSFAKGTEREDSDIDLKQLSSYERFILSGQLAVISGCEVDLIDG